jgi:hypothetical protein
MKTAQPELRGIPQFDSGRWKLRLERVPFSAEKQTLIVRLISVLSLCVLHCALRLEKIRSGRLEQTSS